VAVSPDFEYRSNTNPEWMTVEALRAWIAANQGTIGHF
jgi:hypothetical protein